MAAPAEKPASVCRDGGPSRLYVGCEDYLDYADYDRLVRVSAPRLERPSMVLGERLDDGLVVAQCRYNRHGSERRAFVALSVGLARKLGVGAHSVLDVYVSPRPDPTWPAEPERLHLYLIEIVGVGVKVGITGDPPRRLAQHRSAAANFGRSTGREWLSERRADAAEIERSMVGDHPNEYLPTSFDEAMRRMRELLVS